MNNPRGLIAHLLSHGEVLEREIAAQLTPRGRRAAKSLGREAAKDRGVPVAVQMLGGFLFDSRLDEVRAMFEGRADQFAFQVQQGFERISVATPNLRLSGNSASLVRQLAKANAAAQALTRVRAINRLLKKLAREEIVYNADIPELVKRRQIAKWNEERERKELRYIDLTDLPPGFVSMKFPNGHALLTRLATYPTVREIMEGAIHAASGDAPDGRRQALGSCRRALEALGKELTGRSDWREIVLRVADEDVGAILRKLYSLLSAKGAHGTSRVSEADVELGMQQTFGALFWMVQHADALKSPRKKA